MDTKNMRQVNQGKFNDFVRDHKCTEHFISGSTAYYETGSRTLLAVFKNGNYYIIDTNDRVLPFKRENEHAA